VKRIAFLTAVFVLPFSASSQAVRKAGASPQPRSAQSNSYGITDIAGLVGRLQKLDLTKGEFETKGQYDTRMGTLPVPRGTLVFRLESPAVKYDADSQEMEFELRGDEAGLCLSLPAETTPENTPLICSASECEYTLKRALRKSGSYVGSNPFGVKQTIEYSEYDAYGVLISAASPIQVNRALRSADFRFSIGAEDARALKPFLVVEFIGELDDFLIDSGMDGHKPTLEEPYDLRVYHSYVRFRLERVMMVDKRTNQSVADFTPDLKLEPAMVYRLPGRHSPIK
jgi:hypothetical protein